MKPASCKIASLHSVPRIPTLLPRIPTPISYIPTLIPCIPTLITLIPDIPTHIPAFPPRLPTFHLDSLHSHLDSPRSHPNPLRSHHSCYSVPRFPIPTFTDSRYVLFSGIPEKWDPGHIRGSRDPPPGTPDPEPIGKTLDPRPQMGPGTWDPSPGTQDPI